MKFSEEQWQALSYLMDWELRHQHEIKNKNDLNLKFFRLPQKTQERILEISKNYEAELSEEDKKNYASPHVLMAVPRSLRSDRLWIELGSGARDFYLHLLSYSNTRDFSPVYPSQERLEKELGISHNTLLAHEKKCIAAGILATVQPYSRKDKYGRMIITKSYEFTIMPWRNIDYEEFNKRKGLIVYKRKVDYDRLRRKFSALKSKINTDLTLFGKELDEQLKTILDFSATRMKLVSFDDKFNAVIEFYGKKEVAEIIKEEIPNNIILFPRKSQDDIEINNWKDWLSMLRDIETKRSKIQQSHSVDALQAALAKLA